MTGPSDDEIREEQEHHLASRASLNESAGIAPEEARHSARRTFGNQLRLLEDTRAVYVGRWSDTIRQDLRFAIRSFRRTPAVALAAILVLALGIGSTAAVFSVVDRILFRPLPYPDDQQLVSFGFGAPVEPTEFMLGPDYAEWRKHQTPFSSVTSWSGVTSCDLTEGSALRLDCASVDASLLPTLGIVPILGRNFTAEEDRPGAPRTVILSHALWQGRFGGDRSILEKAVSLDGRPTRVVGVLPAGFELPTLNRFDLLYPQQLTGTLSPRGNMEVVRAFGRLKPATTVSQAEQELTPLFQASLANVPKAFRNEVRLRVRPLRERQTGDFHKASWVLWAAVLSVLAIACANVANLLLARTATRRAELAVRASLGASRRRLVGQIVMESLVLAGVGSVLGLATAWALLAIFNTVAPVGIPRLAQASLDWRAVFLTGGAAMITGVLAAAAPAWFAMRPETLTGGRSVAGTRGAERTRFALVTVQIAASLVLLAGATLLLRSFRQMQTLPMGFAADGVTVAPLTLGRHGYDQPLQRAQLFERILERAAAMPGATAVAISDSVPPSGRVAAMIYSLIEVEGRPREPEGTGGMIPWRLVTPGFFSAMGIPIVKGRPFAETDRDPGQGAVILGEGLAHRLFGAEDPLGKRLRFGRAPEWYAVAGVAGAINNGGLAKSDPEYYLIRKRPSPSVTDESPEARRHATLVIRSGWTTAMAEQWLRSEIASIEPALPVHAEPLERRVSDLNARPRFNAALLSLFATMGLALAAAGLYGVISLLVANRTKEMGIRLALGATPGAVTASVVRKALLWCAAGMTLGGFVAWIARGVLQPLLFQVSAEDPINWLAGIAILAAVAAVAAWIPARRAGAVDPVTALRVDT